MKTLTLSGSDGKTYVVRAIPYVTYTTSFEGRHEVKQTRYELEDGRVLEAFAFGIVKIPGTMVTIEIPE